MRILFLDIDGVLNRCDFKPSRKVGLRSWIEPDLAARLNQVLATLDAKIVLSTSWRIDSNLDELREELRAAGVDHTRLLDMTPDLLADERWPEIDAWMRNHRIAPEAVVIVDDFYEMGPLAGRTVMTDPERGLDEAAASAVLALFASGSVGT
jgi:hypothetical protein